MGESIDLRKHGEPIDVNVVNQLDLSTIESLLTSIKDSAIAIDANTDLVETKLDSVISELQTNGTTNHTDLLNVLTELQSIDANTDGLETQLASIISNTSTNATEVTQLAIKTQIDNLTFTDGKLDVNATVPAPEGGASEVTLADLLLFQKRTENILVSLLEEQQKTNKILKKIYNPE